MSKVEGAEAFKLYIDGFQTQLFKNYHEEGQTVTCTNTDLDIVDQFVTKINEISSLYKTGTTESVTQAFQKEFPALNQ